jgi:hypothetical protein
MPLKLAPDLGVDLAGLPSPPGALGRLLGRFRLGVEDLLEDLAHAGPHELPSLGLGLAIATSRPLELAGVEIVAHRRIVHGPAGRVNRSPRRSATLGVYAGKVSLDSADREGNA